MKSTTRIFTFSLNLEKGDIFAVYYNFAGSDNFLLKGKSNLLVLYVFLIPPWVRKHPICKEKGGRQGACESGASKIICSPGGFVAWEFVFGCSIYYKVTKFGLRKKARCAKNGNSMTL